MLFIGVPSYVVKLPPIKILPLGVIAIASTLDETPDTPDPGSKELSIEPSEFNRAIPFLGTPLYEVKFPPINILPLDCKTVVYTSSFAPVPIPLPKSLRSEEHTSELQS